jgi:hypothetical protein
MGNILKIFIWLPLYTLYFGDCLENLSGLVFFFFNFFFLALDTILGLWVFFKL